MFEIDTEKKLGVQPKIIAFGSMFKFVQMRKRSNLSGNAKFCQIFQRAELFFKVRFGHEKK
jgi:hypothetical protein